MDALLFPGIDRETRFVFGYFLLLTGVVKSGLCVYFAREKLALDPNGPESQTYQWLLSSLLVTFN